MKQAEFIEKYAPLARAAGRAFRINPAVALAQAAIETGWGESELCRAHHNLFGLTAYGRTNAWWTGDFVELSRHSLRFRVYADAACSFMDYCRLLRAAYPRAADLSGDPRAFAQEIAYSKYISEVNGDNRAAYRRALCQIARKIESDSSFLIVKS